MNHPDAEQLWLHAQEALDDDHAHSVANHLAGGCEDCMGIFDRARLDAGTLALAAEPGEPDSDVRARLLARVEGPHGSANRAIDGALERPTRRIPTHWPTALPIAAGLVGFGVLIGALANAALSGSDAVDAAPAPAPVVRAAPHPAESPAFRAMQDERDALSSSLEAERGRLASAHAEAAEAVASRDALAGRLRAAERSLDEYQLASDRLAREHRNLEHALAKANQAVALLESPGVEWVVLSNEDDATQGAARFFWEWEGRDCLIDGGDLPRLSPGQAYALWVAYEDAPPALVTTFAPDAAGAARLLAPLPAGDGEVRTVRITIEEDPNPVAPGGTTLLAGVLF